MTRTVGRSVALRPQQAGFTLLEILVVVALLGLLSTLVFKGLQFGSRAWTAVTRRTEATTDAVAVSRVVKQLIAQAYPAFASANIMDRRIVFQGEAQTLMLVAPLPAAIEAGVMARQRLFVADAGPAHTGTLYLGWRLDLPASDERQELPETRVKLADHIRSIRFAYFGRSEPQQPGAWLDHWSDKTRLPDLVRVRIEDDTERPGVQQELVVQPRVTMTTACVYDPADIACRRIR